VRVTDESSFSNQYHKDRPDLTEEEYYVECNINVILKLLALFNKATREVYPQSIHKKVAEVLSYTNFSSFNFLAKSVAGMVFRKEIVTLYTNFMIFHHELPDIYSKGVVANIVIEEIRLIDMIHDTFLREDLKLSKTSSKLITLNQRRQQWCFLRKYTTNVAIKLIWKYVRGVKFVLHNDNLFSDFIG
jgi:hypothetical protein